MVKVAIIGKVNSGKSTLFNAMVGSSVSITWKEPGTTRDIVEAIAHSKKTDYVLMDTAGYAPYEGHPLQKIMEEQTEKAINEADILICVFDAKSGFSEIDKKIRDRVIKSGKPYIFVVNKVDSKKEELVVYQDFHILGNDFITVSALHKKNIEKIFEKLDEISEKIEDKEKSSREKEKISNEKERILEDETQILIGKESLSKLELEIEKQREKEIEEISRELIEKGKALVKKERVEKIRISFVGRPNVGKSSLINKILGYPRCIVYDEPGTTRDAVRIPFEYEGKKFILVDTPGIRKKSKIDKEEVEFKSIGRSLTAIFVSDVCILVIDSLEGITHQDRHIASLIERRGRALVVALNKIDIIRELKPAGGIGKIVEALKNSARFIKWAYFIPVSAKTGYGIPSLLEAIYSSYKEWTKALKPSELLKIREKLIQLDFMKNQNPKIFQVGIKPPTFLVYVNEPEYLRKHQIMHIQKIIRQLYGFYGSPIHFRVKRHGERY
jgi:GTP-binding protein